MGSCSRGTSVALAVAVFLSSPALAATARRATKVPAPEATDARPVVTPDTTPPPPVNAAPVGAVQVAPAGTAAPAASAAPTAAPPSIPEPPPIPVIARAEACLVNEAPRAAKAEAGAKAAVDLLLDDLCAEPVDAAALYARNAAALAHFTPQSERQAAGLAGARIDPETGRVINPANADVASAVEATDVPLRPPPALRRYAAGLVFKAREESRGGPQKASADPAKARPKSR